MVLERKKIFAAGIFIAVLHVLGIGILTYSGLENLAVAAGLGITAYLLGLRHAFDADHIAAIDNTVRRLSAEKKDSSLVGLFFSLGHSTIVLIAGLAVAFGFTALANILNDDSSALKSSGALIGGSIAGLFLLVIAIVNSTILYKTIKNKHHGSEQSAPKGILTTLFSGLFKNVDKDWKMYPLGLLFGLGFDTATSITLLAVSSTALTLAGGGWVALALPILFMAGMSLGDTIDSVIMSKAYNYHPESKLRKRYFIVITSVSIVAALVIGLPILLENISALFGLSLLSIGIENDNLGLIIAGLLLGVWVAFSIIQRAKLLVKNNFSRFIP